MDIFFVPTVSSSSSLRSFDDDDDDDDRFCNGCPDLRSVVVERNCASKWILVMLAHSGSREREREIENKPFSFDENTWST